MTVDWKARAEREATAIIAEALPNETRENYAEMVTLVAIGWLQGANYADHETLASMDAAFEEMRSAL